MKIRKAFFILVVCFLGSMISLQGEEIKETGGIETDKIENYRIPPNQPITTFIISNPEEKQYLWVEAHAWDKRKIEHGALPLRIEVNDTILEKDRSILQGDIYRYPAQSISWRTNFYKYIPEKKAWSFKYDVDFIMNNNTGSPGNWGAYTTVDYNHWYAFDLKGIVKKDKNKITITELSDPGIWKSNYYDGFTIGEISFCTLEEIKEKIAQYDKKQIKIDPMELDRETLIKHRLGGLLEVPKGRMQKFDVKDGYITRDLKPFFMFYLNPFSSALGREGVLDIYNYYSLINTSMAGAGTSSGREIIDLPIYLREGWDKRKIENWETPYLLAETLNFYKKGILTLPYILYTEASLPYLEENFPQVFAKFSNGEYAKSEGGKWFPNFNHHLFKEYISQTHTVLGRRFRDNPGIFGYSLWEEMGWRTSQRPGKMVPQSEYDLKTYQDYLKEKYKDVGSLNKEWETTYKDFNEIKFPEWKEQTANFANFQRWRANATVDCAKIAYEILKKEDPDHLILGQKTYGDIGAGSGYWTHCIDNFLLTKWTDISREYTDTSWSHLGRNSTMFFNKVMEQDICFSQTPYVEWEEDLWYALLDKKALRTYPYFMNTIFNGSKAFHWEIYDLGYGTDFYFIFYNKRWKAQEKTWRGKKINFQEAGTADVIIPEKTLNISRLQQWCIRNSSLLLPAKVFQPEVAVLTPTVSRFIGYDPDDKLAKTKNISSSWINNPGQDFLLIGNLFDHLHLKFDCIDERNFDDIFKYKVLIIGYQANVGSVQMAEKIKEFVKKGGTVIFYPEAFSFNSINFKNTKESPGFGLGELCCATINNEKIIEKKGIKLADNRFNRSMKKGEVLSSENLFACELHPTQNAIILAVTEDGSPIVVSDSSGKCFYFNSYLGLAYFKSYPNQDNFAKFFEGILQRAGVITPVSIEKTLNKRLIIPGLLEGNGYYLVGLNNFFEEDQKIVVKLNGIKDGVYDVIDISGEKPVIIKSEDGNFHLQPNFEEAQPKYIKTSVKSEFLKKEGVEILVPKYYSKILLLRQARGNVSVNSTIQALTSYIVLKKPLKIVIGRSSPKDEKNLASQIQTILSLKGIQADIVDDTDIKTKVIKGKIIEDGYKLEEYEHEVIDDTNNLILIGNPETNQIIKHLHTPGKYTYCKVPEMISKEYPGNGRGIIQIAECINKISFDATDKSTDAILISGSDREGIKRAELKFIEILRHDIK